MVTGTELALPSTSSKPTPPPRRFHTHAGIECHSTNNTRNCKGYGQTGIQNQKIQEIPAGTSSRGPEVISPKKTLRKLTQVKGLQYNRYLKDGLINCTYLFIHIT